VGGCVCLLSTEHNLSLVRVVSGCTERITESALIISKSYFLPHGYNGRSFVMVLITDEVSHFSDHLKNSGESSASRSMDVGFGIDPDASCTDNTRSISSGNLYLQGDGR
jgi:hypothetical protein